MLHYYNMRQIPTEAIVKTIGEIILNNNLIRGAAEKHSIAVSVVPAIPVNTPEFRHEIFCIVHHPPSLIRPTVDADGLCHATRI